MDKQTPTPSRTHPCFRARRLVNSLLNYLSWDPWYLKCLNGSFWILAIFISSLITLIEFADPDGEQNIPIVLLGVVNFLHKNSFVIVCGLLGIQISLAIARASLNWFYLFDKSTVKEILDSAVSHHFDQTSPEEHHYRATLFKIRYFWPFGQWLGIVCRSGQNYQNSNTIFSFNPMKKNECTGIAGECARQNATIIKSIERSAYRSEGFVSKEEEGTINVASGVFLATPIRTRNGKRWGVLVLDTTDAQKLPSKNQEKRVGKDLDHWELAIKIAISK